MEEEEPPVVDSSDIVELATVVIAEVAEVAALLLAPEGVPLVADERV